MLFLTDDDVVCLICGKKFRLITLTHLKTHSLNFISYKELFPNVELTCLIRKKELSLYMTGRIRPPVSEKQKKRMHDLNIGKHLSLEQKQKISSSTKGIKKSEETKKRISIGLKGRIFTDEWKKKLRKPKSESCKLKMKETAQLKFIRNPELKNILSKATRKWFSDHPECGKNIAESNRRRNIHNGGPESQDHIKTKNKIKDLLSSLGYVVTLERFISFGSKRYAIDVYAKNDDRSMLFEIGDCKVGKIENLQSCYSYVYHVPKQKFLVDNIK